MAGGYETTGANFEGRALNEVREEVLGGPGPAAMSQAGGVYPTVMESLVEFERYVADTISQSKVVRQGVAADASVAAISPMASFARDAQAKAMAGMDGASQAGDHYGRVRASLPEAMDPPSLWKLAQNVAVPVSAMDPSSNYFVQQGRYDARHAEMTQAMNTYQSSSNSNAASMPVFDQPQDGVMQAGATPAPYPPPQPRKPGGEGGGRNPGGSGPGGGGSGGSPGGPPGGGEPGSRGPGSGVGGGGSPGGPPGRSPGEFAGVAGPGGTTAQGFSPAQPSGVGPGAVGGLAPGEFGPAGSDQGVSFGGIGGATGFGAVGRGGWGGSSAGGAGSGSPGSESRLGPGAHAGADEGPDRVPRPPAAGSAGSAGSAGALGAGGRAGMGAAPIGGGMSGRSRSAEDTEHETAKYLINNDESFWTSGIPRTAPPVIGAFDPDDA